jgi:hypothetical protein
MTYLLRIEIDSGKTISERSDTQTLLDALAAAQMKQINLTADQEEALRGWLLLHAQKLAPGTTLSATSGTSISIGKRKSGSAYIHDYNGEWPPEKPTFGAELAKES